MRKQRNGNKSSYAVAGSVKSRPSPLLNPYTNLHQVYLWYIQFSVFRH